MKLEESLLLWILATCVILHGEVGPVYRLDSGIVMLVKMEFIDQRPYQNWGDGKKHLKFREAGMGEDWHRRQDEEQMRGRWD